MTSGKKPAADVLRERGNVHFKAGRLQEAAESYSESVQIDPSAAAFANRAAIHLRLKTWDKAESDGTAALALDPDFVKAYYRRWARMDHNDC